MILLIKIAMVVIVACMHSYALGVPNEAVVQSFIIKQPENKKKYSTNELKEKLGGATEDAFEHTTHVTEHLGKVQIAFAQQSKGGGNDSVCVHGALGRVQQTVACMQRRCSSIVKKLIDNEVPFKKAKKIVLQKTLDVLMKIRDDLVHVTNQLKAWHCKMLGKSVQVVEFKASVEKCEKKIVDAHATMQQDECLKYV